MYLLFVAKMHIYCYQFVIIFTLVSIIIRMRVVLT